MPALSPATLGTTASVTTKTHTITSLAPTPTYFTADVLRRDIGSNTCGWIGGSSDKPQTCQPFQTCVWNRDLKNVGCQNGYGSSQWRTSCIPYQGECDSGCKSDVLIVKCGSQLPVCATPLFAGGYTALFCWNSELPDPFVIAATYDGFTTPIKLPRYIGVDNSYTYETQTPTGASEALTASIPQITGSDFGKTSLNLSGSSTVPTISNGFTGFSSMPTALNGKGLSTSDRIAVGVGAPVGLFTIVGAVCAVLALIKRKRKVGLVLKTEQGSRDELRLEMRGIQKPESSEPEDEEPSDPQGKESPHI